MKIQFKNPTFIELVVDIENDEPIYDEVSFSSNEVHDVQILDESGTTIDIQFGDGSVVFELDRNLIEIL